MLKSLIGINATSISISLLAQSVVPEPLVSLFEQLPFIGILIWLGILMDKRQREDTTKSREFLKELLESQRKVYITIYETQGQLISNLLSKLDLLNQQISINTATVGEVATMGDIINQLIAGKE